MSSSPIAACARTDVRTTAGLCLGMFLASLANSGANVALPTLAVAFDAAFADVQWVVVGHLLASTAVIVAIGRLGDRIGRARLMSFGLALFTTASMLCGLAPTLGILIGARALQGVGSATLMVLSLSLIAETGPARQTGRAMGLIGAASATGTALGPTLGGILIAAAGWPSIFLVNVPLGLMAILLLGRSHWRRAEGRRSSQAFDIVGSAVFAATLAAYVFALASGRHGFGWLNLGLLVAAALGLWLFLRVERRLASPLIQPALLRRPRLRTGLAISALVTTVMMSTLIVGPFVLSAGLGLDAVATGLALSVGPAVAALTGLPAGRFTDRVGARRALMLGLSGVAAGAASLALLPESAGVTGYLLAMAALTAGYAMFQTANNALVMAGASADERGVVSGLLTLSRQVGLVTGASMMGGIFAAAAGDVVTAGPQRLVTAMHATFAVATLLVLVAVAIAWKSYATAIGGGAIGMVSSKAAAARSTSASA